LLVLCGLFRGSEGLWAVAATYLAENLESNEWYISDLQKAFLVAAPNIGSVCGSPIWGSLSDRFGRTKTYLLCALLTTAFAFIAGGSSSYVMLVIFQFLAGVTLCGHTAATTLLSEFSPAESRGRTIVALQFAKV
jgi:putative MFS transporter